MQIKHFPNRPKSEYTGNNNFLKAPSIFSLIPQIKVTLIQLSPLTTIKYTAANPARTARSQRLRVEDLLHVLARTNGRLQMPRRPAPAVLGQNPIQAAPQKVLAPPLAIPQVQILRTCLNQHYHVFINEDINS